MQNLRVSRLFLAASAITLTTSVAGAQVRIPAPSTQRVGRGVIDGTVTDDNLAPLHAAFISILGTPIKIGTGPNGRFRITGVPAGNYLVIVKRVGYRPTSGVVEVPANDTLRLAYTLDKVDAKALETVVVTEKSPSIKMQEFEARRKLGVGEFMTREQIEKHNAVYSTELFRTFKAVYVAPDNSGPITQYYALSKREGGNPQVGACPMQVYVDQVPLPSPFNLDLLPPPRDLAGIEVYAGAATIPPMFNGYDRGCGVILIWTKDSST